MEFKLTREAPASGLTVRAGFAPTECFFIRQAAVGFNPFAPIADRSDLNAGPHPIYYFRNISFAAGELTSVAVIRSFNCTATSFSIHTWADQNIANFNEANYTFREVDFVIPE
ncbi:MAG: hypothetical protein MK180_07650 [Rhodobacteraceae bacterium]|nr:hypothetical protein [Paracoccaceae bacterium]